MLGECRVNNSHFGNLVIDFNSSKIILTKQEPFAKKKFQVLHYL